MSWRRAACGSLRRRIGWCTDGDIVRLRSDGSSICAPEIIPEKESQALVRHRVATHRLQLSLHLRDGFRIRLVAERHLLELRALELEVALVREENAFGRKTVTPRVDELLIVALEAFRHRVVQHETHIRPLELEKRIRRHDEDPGSGMGLGMVRGRPLYTLVGRMYAGAESAGICHSCVRMPTS